MKKLNSEIYKIDEIYNFRDLVTHSANKYPDNVAYKFKINLGKSNQEVIEKTYSQIKEEVEAFGTSLLKLGLENKKIAVIGNNRYEWCVSYLTITTSNMVVVPLDKALPDAEIKSLIKRSKADAVVYENKYSKVFEEIKKDETTLKHFINMDLEKEENGILSFKELVEKGKEERKNGNKSYEEVKIDNEKMSILIFTSGTTSSAKAVMLSQRNIMKNIYALELVEDIRRGDVNMAFLPYHHTFGSTGQFLMLAVGATTVYCDGLKYVQKNLQEYGVSVFVGVPLIVESLYKKVMAAVKKQGKAEKLNKGIKLSNFLRKLGIDKRRSLFKDVLEPLGGRLRLIVSGASALDPTVSKTLDAMGITVIQGYGMTECSPVIAA